jgi:Ser/Thr protein kinase RdoA (MazF antagonist)
LGIDPQVPGSVVRPRTRREDRIVPAEVLAEFGLSEVDAVVALRGGYLHRTYLVVGRKGREDGRAKLVLQRISDVFAEPETLAANAALIASVINNDGIPGVRVPDPVLAAGGGLLARAEGSWWRAFEYLEHSPPSRVGRMARCAVAARGMALYSRIATANLAGALRITIEGFHDLAMYFDRFLAAAKGLPGASRLEEQLMERALETRWVVEECSALVRALPARVAHNDAKADNVLVLPPDGQAKGRRCAIVDLDTTFEGRVFFDFGDLVRSTCTPITEEGGHTEGSEVSWRAFDEVARGYLGGWAGLLSRAEIASLSFGPVAVAWETAIRFLTDHLEGDVYFRVRQRGDNLRRSARMWALFDVFLKERDRFAEHIERLAATAEPPAVADCAGLG